MLCNWDFRKNCKKGLDICTYKCYHVITAKGNQSNFGGKCQKGEPMSDIMTDYQFKTLLKMFLDILKSSQNIEEASEKVENLLEDKENK